jgi:hypothetical protein
MSAKFILSIIAVIYILGVFITYFCMCYIGAKKSKVTNSYSYKVDEGDVAITILWPMVLALMILIAPFKFTKMLALKMKDMANPNVVNVNKIIKNE